MKQKNLVISFVLLLISFAGITVFGSEMNNSVTSLYVFDLISIITFIGSVVFLIRSIFLKESIVGFVCVLFLELLLLVELALRSLWINPFLLFK